MLTKIGLPMSFRSDCVSLRRVRCLHDRGSLWVRDRISGAVGGNAHRRHTGIVAASAASTRHHQRTVQQGADAQDQHGGELFCFHGPRIRRSRCQPIAAQPQWFWQCLGLGAYPPFESANQRLHCFFRLLASVSRRTPIPATNSP